MGVPKGTKREAQLKMYSMKYKLMTFLTPRKKWEAKYKRGPELCINWNRSDLHHDIAQSSSLWSNIKKKILKYTHEKVHLQRIRHSWAFRGNPTSQKTMEWNNANPKRKKKFNPEENAQNRYPLHLKMKWHTSKANIKWRTLPLSDLPYNEKPNAEMIGPNRCLSLLTLYVNGLGHLPLLSCVYEQGAWSEIEQLVWNMCSYGMMSMQAVAQPARVHSVGP